MFTMVIHRYHGTVFTVDDCNTMSVLVFGCDLVLLTRYVIQILMASRITTPAAKNFFAGACITIQELFVYLHRRF